MKYIRIFVLIMAACSSVYSFGQKGGAGFLSLSGGVSLPTGNWSKTSSATSLMSINGTVDDKSGYAKAGAFGALDGAYFFSKHFGIGGMFKYGTYSLKGVDSLSQGYEESFDVDTTRTTPTNYKIWTIMPGIYYTAVLDPKLSFMARALAGIAHATTPQIIVTIEDGGVFDTPVEQYSATKTSFAWDVGVGLRYKIAKSFAIGLNADYFYTKPDFQIQNSQRPNNAGREVTEYNQPLSSVNFSLGIAYLFKK